MTEQSYLSPREAAAYINVSRSLLDHKRVTGGGPPFSKISHRNVRYSRVDLDQWMASVKVRSTSEVPCVAPLSSS